MLRYDEASGAVSTFRAPAGFPNGNTLDRQGRLITCEHGGRRISRTEFDGTVTTLADRFEEKLLNSPNDAVVKSDGSIWFTDPTYGIDSDYEGHKRAADIDGCFVFRLDPVTGALRVVADDFVRPNGIAFSPDESLLYVADTGATHVKDGPRHIRRFRVKDRDRLDGGEIFATSPADLFDGLRIDTDGRIWTSTGDGVCVYAPDGTLIGRVRVPEVIANVEFGGSKRNYLFICATTSLYAIRVTVNGARRP